MLDVLVQQLEHWHENNQYKLPSQARLHWSAVFDPIDIDWMIRLAPNPLRHIRTCSYGSRSEANSIDDIIKIAPVNLTSITEVYLVCRTCRDTLFMIVTILWWSLYRVAGTSATF